MAKRGAPFGNKNAAGGHKGGALKLGQSKGLRAHLGSKVNYSSAGFLKAAAAQKKRGY